MTPAEKAVLSHLTAIIEAPTPSCVHSAVRQIFAAAYLAAIRGIEARDEAAYQRALCITAPINATDAMQAITKRWLPKHLSAFILTVAEAIRADIDPGGETPPLVRHIAPLVVAIRYDILRVAIEHATRWSPAAASDDMARAADREERTAAFIRDVAASGERVSYRAIFRAALVESTAFYAWLRGGLPDTSTRAARIEQVLAGKINLRRAKKPTCVTCTTPKHT